MDNTNAKPVIFDVFLCHNNEDKPTIREIADQLEKQGLKPWLDEREIKPGTLWQSALEEQIVNIKSVVVFVGESGIGPWQDIEIRAFINEFAKRKCPVIPAILPSAKTEPPLPILLQNLHYVDFRISAPDPLRQLQWGITGQKPPMQTLLAGVDANNTPDLLAENEKQSIEIRLGTNFDKFTSEEKLNLINGLNEFLKTGSEVKIIGTRPGSTRIFIELKPEDADRIYSAVKSGELKNLGITHARYYPSLADPPDEKQRSQLLIFLNRVQEFWIDGVLEQSLYHEVLIALGKRAMDDAVELPWKSTVNLPKQRHQILLNDAKIETIFDSTGLLLILGEPGSGKTTTMLELAAILIKRAQTDTKERIPFILNLSSWTPQQTLADWIASKLSLVYSVPKKLALKWLEKGYLVPMLDGLDEIKTEQQAECVTAINIFIMQYDLAGLVVCCRLTEYQWLSERLKLNGAICIEPLNTDQIENYFAAIGSGFESLRTAIQQDVVLQELAQSPLMLNIMSMAYQSATVAEIEDSTNALEIRRTQIFNAYVDKMFVRKNSKTEIFPKQKVLSGLSWLAKKMTEHSQTVFFVENLQPSWLDNWKQKFVYKFVSSLIFGFIYGVTALAVGVYASGSIQYGVLNGLLMSFISILIIGLFARSHSIFINGIISGVIFVLAVWPIMRMVYESKFALVTSLINAVIFGVFICFGVGAFTQIKTIETVHWTWHSFFKILKKVFLLCGLTIGVGVGISEKSLITGVLMFVTFGLIFGLLGGIIGGFEVSIREDKARPNQGIKLSIKNSLYIGLILLFISGTIFGILYLYMIQSEAGIMAEAGYVMFWLIVSIVALLNRGFSAVIKHYVLRLTLFLSNKTPLKFIPFLDYCAKLILLKKVGGGYIFIHRMLLEYFANLDSADTKSTISNNPK